MNKKSFLVATIWGLAFAITPFLLVLISKVNYFMTPEIPGAVIAFIFSFTTGFDIFHLSDMWQVICIGTLNLLIYTTLVYLLIEKQYKRFWVLLTLLLISSTIGGFLAMGLAGI